MLTFLTGTGGVLVINALSSFCKNYIYPRWGGTGIHVFSMLVALTLAGGYQFYTNGDGLASLDFKGWVEQAGIIYTAAVTLYELLFKRIGDNLNLG